MFGLAHAMSNNRARAYDWKTGHLGETARTSLVFRKPRLMGQ